MLLVIKLLFFVLVPIVIFGLSAKQEVEKPVEHHATSKSPEKEQRSDDTLPADFTIHDLIAKDGGNNDD